MSIDNLRSGLPEYAKDLKLNLGSLTRSTELDEEQLWGTLLACSAATQNETVFSEVSEEAKEHLSDEAFEAALGAASIMSMNNVAYRTRHMLGDEFTNIKFGLRMNIIAKPGVAKANFELWAMAVSAMNGCETCVTSHDKVVRQEGLTKEQTWEAVKVAGTMAGVAQAVFTEAAR